MILGEDFAGVLSSDCWSAYGPQSAGAKQKCWAHLERELKALTTSRFPENREFAHRVFPLIHTARQAHRDYHQGHLSLAELQAFRPIIEAELADVLEHPRKGRWAADSQALSNWFRRHWSDWFTFLTSPEVNPDNQAVSIATKKLGFDAAAALTVPGARNPKATALIGR